MGYLDSKRFEGSSYDDWLFFVFFVLRLSHVTIYERVISIIHIASWRYPLCSAKVLVDVVNPPRGGGGYMTCGWTGVCRPVFRKVPSSNYRNLRSYPLKEVKPPILMNFGGKPPIFLLFFANFWITQPCLRKICRKRDPCLENLGPKNPPIWAAHTRTLNMLCTPPGNPQ